MSSGCSLPQINLGVQGDSHSRRPCLGPSLPPYTIITHLIERQRQLVELFNAEIVEVEIGGVAIYRPFGNFAELNRTVTCMVLKANDRRTSRTLNFVGLDLTSSDREPESFYVSAQKSRISRLERSTTESNGLTGTFSKVPCMTGWSFNLSVELKFRNCGNLRKCDSLLDSHPPQQQS
ncbi:hypothetical protein TNCV_1520311 [Trichonephila clavipes]|nr:hypothetical protein TNCV_1520311 [Trichonephila clavipes]